ncbi:hypothetical protein CAEBREN_12643 [Caenorhabditis brenneri]|uniref:Uncharacterized protein n=1 Tax=Caenorhabditis brenneri TaxID=135651 RepID=G0M793_CAEBE|nr:hypothetical protein CAEBREN_12643 [Caenorhabditis brenneri]
MSSRRDSSAPSGQFSRQNPRQSAAPNESRPLGTDNTDYRSLNNPRSPNAFNSSGSPHREGVPGNAAQWFQDSSAYRQYGSKGRGDTFQCTDPTVTSPNPSGEAGIGTSGSNRFQGSRKSPFRIDPAVNSPNYSYHHTSKSDDCGFYGGIGAASFIPDESTAPPDRHSSRRGSTVDRDATTPLSQQENLQSAGNEAERRSYRTSVRESDYANNTGSQSTSGKRDVYEENGHGTSARSDPPPSQPISSQKGSRPRSSSRSRSTHQSEHVARVSSSNPSESMPRSSQSSANSTKSFMLTEWEKSQLYSPFFQPCDQNDEYVAELHSKLEVDDGNGMISSNQPAPSPRKSSPTPKKGLSSIDKVPSLDNEGLYTAKEESSALRSASGSVSNTSRHTAKVGVVQVDVDSKIVPTEERNSMGGGTPKTAMSGPSASNEAIKTDSSQKTTEKKVFGPRDENSDPNRCHFDPKTRILTAPDCQNKRTAYVGLLDRQSSPPPNVPFVGFYTTPTPRLSPMPIIVVNENMYRLMNERQEAIRIPFDFEFTLFPFLETNRGLLRGPYRYCENERLARFMRQVDSNEVMNTEFMTNGGDLAWRRNRADEIRSKRLEQPIKDTPSGKRKVPDGKKDNLAGVQYPQYPTIFAKEAKNRYEFGMRPEKPVTTKSLLDKQAYSKNPIPALDLNQDIDVELQEGSQPSEQTSASALKSKGGVRTELSYDSTQKESTGQRTNKADQEIAKTPSLTSSSATSGHPNSFRAILKETKAKLQRRTQSEDRESKRSRDVPEVVVSHAHRSRSKERKATASSSKPKVTFNLPKTRRRLPSIHARDDNDPAQKLFNKQLDEFRASNPKMPPKVYGKNKVAGPLGMPSFHEPSNDDPSDVLIAQPQFIAVDRMEYESEYGPQPLHFNVFPKSMYSEDKENLKKYFGQDHSAQTGLSLLGLVHSPQPKSVRSQINIHKLLYQKYLAEEEVKRNSPFYYKTENDFQSNMKSFVEKFPFRSNDSDQMEKRTGQAARFLKKPHYFPDFFPADLWYMWQDAVRKENRVAILDAMYFYARGQKLIVEREEKAKYENEWKFFLTQIFPEFSA